MTDYYKKREFVFFASVGFYENEIHLMKTMFNRSSKNLVKACILAPNFFKEACKYHKEGKYFFLRIKLENLSGHLYVKLWNIFFF